MFMSDGPIHVTSQAQVLTGHALRMYCKSWELVGRFIFVISAHNSTKSISKLLHWQQLKSILLSQIITDPFLTLLQAWRKKKASFQIQRKTWIGLEKQFTVLVKMPVIRTQPSASVQIKSDWKPITKKKLHTHILTLHGATFTPLSGSWLQQSITAWCNTVRLWDLDVPSWQIYQVLIFQQSDHSFFSLLCLWIKFPSQYKRRGNAWKYGHVPG